MIDRITLNLKNHCIERVAKNLFKKLMDDIFLEKSDIIQVEEKIEFIREFIEKANFKELRASDLRFTGDSKIVISKNDDEYRFEFI
jgi:hypothetical protein